MSWLQANGAACAVLQEQRGQKRKLEEEDSDEEPYDEVKWSLQDCAWTFSSTLCEGNVSHRISCPRPAVSPLAFGLPQVLCSHCRLWEDGWKDRYYQSKFDVGAEEQEFKIYSGKPEKCCLPSWRWPKLCSYLQFPSAVSTISGNEYVLGPVLGAASTTTRWVSPYVSDLFLKSLAVVVEVVLT